MSDDDERLCVHCATAPPARPDATLCHHCEALVRRGRREERAMSDNTEKAAEIVRDMHECGCTHGSFIHGCQHSVRRLRDLLCPESWCESCPRLVVCTAGRKRLGVTTMEVLTGKRRDER